LPNSVQTRGSKNYIDDCALQETFQQDYLYSKTAEFYTLQLTCLTSCTTLR